MPQGILQSFSEGFTANGGLSTAVARTRQNDIAQQNADTSSETLKLNKVKARMDQIGNKMKIVTNKNLPDNMRIQAANEYEQLKGSSVSYNSIEQIDRNQAIFTKANNLIEARSKNSIDDKTLEEGLRGLDMQLKVANGSDSALEGRIKADEAKKAKREEDDVLMLTGIIRNTAGGKQPSPEDAKNRIQIQQRYGNDFPALVEQAKQLLESERTTGRSSAAEVFANLSTSDDLADREKAEKMMDFRRQDQFSAALDRTAGAESGKLKIELEGQIINSMQSNETIKRGLELLDSRSGIFSGPLSNTKTNFNKYLKEFGVEIAGEQIENTEAFAAVMARDVINILGSGALGAGTGISDNDRAFAAKIVGGDTTLDEKSIRKLLELNKRVNDAKITINNRRLRDIKAQRESNDPFASSESIKQTAEPTEDDIKAVNDFMNLK